MPLNETGSRLPYYEGRLVSRDDLGPSQLWLVDVMRQYQFGRIENMQVEAGVPLINGAERVVRISRLGGSGGATDVPGMGNFELKRSVRDLFAELARLQSGLILTLEFRHGLPWLLETTDAPASRIGTRA